MRLNAYFLIFVFSVCSLPFFAQTTQTEFGKNRVQYNQDFAEWSKYESQNFITYWYGEGRLIGQSVVQMAEYDFKDILGILEYRLNDKIQIIVYVDLTDLKQSNIGSEEAFENTGGQTKIAGNKMFVFFNGDHNDLRRQVREGIASVYLDAMLFGSNLQEIVQNAVTMNLPDWFKQGLVAFVGAEWNTESDNQLKDILLSGKFRDFEEIAEKYPKLAGHSLWYFISQNFGNSTVSNLLYLTRINRSIESGFLYVLGSTFRKTIDSWEEFFRQRYEEEAKNTQEPQGLIKVKNKHNLPLTQLKISPNGTKIAYVANEIGKQRVYIQDLLTGDREVVFKNGFRNAIQATDYGYPLLAWNPSGYELSIIYERRDVVKLMKYDMNTKQSKTEDMSTQFQRIYSVDYVNPVDLVFSASVRGQSDLFLYFTLTRQSRRLTNDFWDDRDAVYTTVHGQRGILFSSNRQDSINIRERLDTILPLNTYDIFYLNFDSEKANELVRITRTPYANERQPVSVDSTWFSFLTDASGIYNRQTGYLEDYIHHFENVITFEDGTEMRLPTDSVIAEVLDSVALAAIDTVILDTIIKQRAINHFNSNYDRSILELSKSNRTNRMAEVVYRDGGYRFFVNEMDPTQQIFPAVTNYQQQQINVIETLANVIPNKQPTPPLDTVLEPVGNEPAQVDTLPEIEQDTNKIDIDNYLFQSEFDDEEIPVPPVAIEPEEDQGDTTLQRQLTYRPKTGETEGDGKKVVRFRPGRITPYRVKFRSEFVTTQLDNSQLFDGLNSFSGVPQDFGYQDPGILLKANFKDLFEDYEFEAGMRIPTSFNGAEYFLLFNDRKKRLDKRYAVYRRRLKFTDNGASTSSPTQPKTKNVILLGQYQLRYPLDVFTSIRATATIRLDNTTQLATDRRTLETATQRQQHAGIKLEYVFDNTLDVALNIKNGTRYKFSVEFVKALDINLSDNAHFKVNNKTMTVLGLDFRHYQRVLKHSVLAGRLAGATSIGKEKILFQLGGTDNWLFPTFNTEVPQPDPGDGEFVFQTVATNLRGFDLNIRNGNSYALLNIEFRMPVFRYILPRAQSPFLRNFQLVGFFDGGTAWQGLSPFNDDSPLNTSTISNTNVTVQVNFFRDPIVYGYGGGIRALLFGYFVRLDYAWGIETRVVQDPKVYFSIGMDF